MEYFHSYTKKWFQDTFGKPTAVQELAWPAIAAGEHTLVSAPTGTGKTLSAFLVFIDQLMAQALEGALEQEVQVIYVSPLKALASDIRENLTKPLQGISERISLENEGAAVKLDVAIRTGDTTQEERRKMLKKPPHILITTPESLYLMLTAKTARTMLSTARAVILDELHAIIDTKRGAHLMLSLARLDMRCEKPLQRIGLSATIKPVEMGAKYLCPDKVTIVEPQMEKKVELLVTDPFSEVSEDTKDSIWRDLARTVYAHCQKHSSVIAFVEGRMYAERLAHFINELAGEEYARAHHGSLSKEQRAEVEAALRSGSLRLLCATSSMELGIDVGAVSLVLQVGCPRTVSSTMQRLGRAGHRPGETSVMYLFPRASAEALYCGLTAEAARRGGIEYSRPPRLCLDILAQHLVSMSVWESYTPDDVMEILKRAYPFTDVTRADIHDVLCMLAGDYEHQENIPARPRLLYDRIHGKVEGDAYSRMLAVMAGGTIPDKGMFTAKTESGVKLGELEEEFVFESRVGDNFMLGTFAWKIKEIRKDVVIVQPVAAAGARLPFWKGDVRGRKLQVGKDFGQTLRRLGDCKKPGQLQEELRQLGLDAESAKGACEFLERQMEATGSLPDDKTIVIEHFRDETGNDQIMVHSVFGRQINGPLALLTAEAAKKQTEANINYVEDDDGFLLFPYDQCKLPEGLLYQIEPETAGDLLDALLPVTPQFAIAFRYNANRALMMGVRNTGRQPLWVQRMRSAELLDTIIARREHPLIRETKRECLEDYWDLDGVMHILHCIQAGEIKVREVYTETASPMSLPLRQQTETSMMYEYTPVTQGVHKATDTAVTELKLLAPAEEQLAHVTKRRRLPEDEKQLHSLLMMEGDLTAGELDVSVTWLESLARQERVSYIEPGLWIAAEHLAFYQQALYEEEPDAISHMVVRLLRYRGGQPAEHIAERYLLPEIVIKQVLVHLKEAGQITEQDEIYYHTELYERARTATVKSRRKQVQTQPASRYAALLSRKLQRSAPPAEQLEYALMQLQGHYYLPELWETVLLPVRVKQYRGELLDSLLAQGTFFWEIREKKGLAFHLTEDVDWEAEQSEQPGLSENEQIIYDALSQRGASFMQRLSGLLGGESPYDTLMDLAGKGLVCADSFVPVRQIKKKAAAQSARQRAGARVKAGTSGRWEVMHTLRVFTAEEQLERNFDQSVIVCRETISGMTWAAALEILRVWEYTGQVRRGYFVEGMSGIQFVREKDYVGTMFALDQPEEGIVWLSGADPAQPWGKYLPHMEGRAFMNIPGTMTALEQGEPVAVLERKGKTLRIFEPDSAEAALKACVHEFQQKRMYPDQNRIVMKEYPGEAEEVLRRAGFRKEMREYVLYRN